MHYRVERATSDKKALTLTVSIKRSIILCNRKLNFTTMLIAASHVLWMKREGGAVRCTRGARIVQYFLQFYNSIAVNDLSVVLYFDMGARALQWSFCCDMPTWQADAISPTATEGGNDVRLSMSRADMIAIAKWYFYWDNYPILIAWNWISPVSEWKDLPLFDIVQRADLRMCHPLQRQIEKAANQNLSSHLLLNCLLHRRRSLWAWRDKMLRNICARPCCKLGQ